MKWPAISVYRRPSVAHFLPQRLRLVREREVPAQKWMNFYTKVISRFATTKSLRLTVAVEVAP